MKAPPATGLSTRLHGKETQPDIHPSCLRLVGQARIVPAEILFPARIGCGHNVAGIGGDVKKRMLENLACMVTGGELRHGVMHVLVLLVFQLHRHDGQAIEKEHEINLLIGLAKVEVRAKSDAVLSVFLTAALSAERGLG